MLSRLDELLGTTPPPTEEDLHAAFWQACHGGQRRAAERLLAAGADITASPDYAHNQTALDAATRPDTRRDLFASWLRERGAKS
jgi:ankyrin repeat protein